MRVPLSWLREFAPIELSADELADVLTAVGVKVEDIVWPWAGLQGVVVAEVVDVSDHPESDKLCVVRVRTETTEAIVCAGVRNFAAGDLVCYAPPGSRVPALPDPLAVRELRGVPSEGMLCSPKELNIADVHTGIMVIADNVKPGVDVAHHFGLEDAVLDIEIEPNRPDLMSVIGVAREAAAVAGAPFAVPEPVIEESGEGAGNAATVDILDFDRCPHYLARVIRGVTVGDAPVRAQARLTASGMRPISNVVDATNYVLLEIGHPLHPFDLDLLDGAAIVVRDANEGEVLETLDGVERTLTTEDLVIADRTKGVAVAGVMGSASAEVSASTHDVLLESAYFRPGAILRTARRLGLSTEASMRFERGADPEAVRRAADRAAELIVAWSGGSVLAGTVEAGEVPERRSVAVRPERAAAVIGDSSLTGSEIARRLETVGLAAEVRGGEVVAEVPGFRVDVQREVDLIEEIARVERGYERIGSTLPRPPQAGGVPDGYVLRRRVRELLVAQGLSEVRSFSFASRQDLVLMGDDESRAIRIANPLAAGEGFLRTRLTPGLLRAVRHNRAHNVARVAIFEVGTIFRRDDPVEERQKAGFALAGPATPGWSGDGRELDFFDAKGVLESLLEGLGIPTWELGGAAPPPFHPGRSAEVLVAERHAGVVGELHPSVAEEMDLGGRVALGVLSVDALADARRAEVAYREVPRLPPVLRDLAFVVDEGVAAAAVGSALADEGGDAVGEVALFDVFTGSPLPEGKKNLAFSVEFRAPDRTMTDDEVDEIVARMAARLASDLGAELRG